MGMIFCGNRHLVHFWRMLSIAIGGGEAGSTPVASNKILTEEGDGILLESGDSILLEG